MNLRNLSCLFACMALLALVSCQKAYERPDITLGTGTGTGGTGTGGTTSGTGKLLIKSEAKTAGNTTEGVVITYEYDANNRLIKVMQVYTDSSNQLHNSGSVYRRDASGRITRIGQNIPGATPGSGLPDSLYIDVHYPSSTSKNFDYTVSKIDFMGMVYMDSSVFTHANGVITAKMLYSGISGLSPMALAGRIEYTYSNGNLVSWKEYAASSLSTPVATLTSTYDDKTSPLTNGIEAFLPGIGGEGTISKNNVVKEIYVDNSTSQQLLNVSYSFTQFNSDNQPTGGSLQQTVPIVKTQAVKFTYR